MNDSFFTFLLERRVDLFNNTLEHLFLTGISTVIAVLIGIPLGIIAYRSTLLRRIILPVAGIIQTIPSLAILAFLLTYLGIGMEPAIAALILYALLPIIRNTCTGLDEIPKDVIEAANGIGFTNWQRLWIVELPLAVPVIITGIRTAAVICVGIATLSSLIGGGGLGDFIFRGISLNNKYLILLGAIPAAVLALLIDWFVGWIESLISWKKAKA